MNVQRICETALQGEREGMDFFQRNAGRMSHAAAVEIFHKLVAEGQKHIEFIQGLLKALESDQSALETSIGLEQEDFFAQRAELGRLDGTPPRRGLRAWGTGLRVWGTGAQSGWVRPLAGR